MTGQVTGNLATRVAANIRIAQAQARVSNMALAAACGVSPRTIGKWRVGAAEPRLAHVEALAVALGRPVAWFYTEHELSEVA